MSTDSTYSALTRLCEDIGTLAPAAFADRDAALAWLAQRLRRHSGCAVQLWLLPLLGGSPFLGADTPVHSTAPTSLLGEPVDVLSDTLLSERVVDGPAALGDVTLTPDERLLLFRVRLDFALVWVQISGLRDHLAPEAWRGLLPAALHAFLRLLDFEQRRRYRDRQDRFFEKLLGANSSDPNQVFTELSQAWQDFAGARWSWIWLYNDYARTYELTAAASALGINDPACLPSESVRPSDHSVAAYTSRVNQVQVVTDLAGWNRTLDGDDYRVIIPQEIQRLGGGAFVCVPLVAPPSAAQAALLTSEIRGAVSLHYRHAGEIPSVRLETLRRMGQATAQAIVNCYMACHRNIFVRLNGMAQKYLTRVSRRPVEDRKAYLNELIRLIQCELHFCRVSIFYRIPFDDALECLASTGICKRGGQLLPPERVTEVVYRGQGRTWRCFAEGTPRIYSREDVEREGDVALSCEVEPPDAPRPEPFTLYPIPDPAEGRTGRALGVIRCVKLQRPAGTPMNSRFLKLELQPLDFIAQQIGPVLQTLESRILRERTISIVKHDLYAPLNMIRDTIDRIVFDFEAGKPVREYDIKDLGASHILARNLVDQLDPDPSQLARFQPAPTFLEGDILARVVNMLRHFAWEQKRIRIEFENIRAIPQLNIDRDLVERAIQNLLLNAVKYGTRDTTVTIRGRRTTAGFCLDVSNEGIGVEPDEVEYIGKANYRSPRAQKVAVGLGLGLSITRSVMEKHGGKLFLTRPKNPTVFSLFFPKALAIESRKG